MSDQHSSSVLLVPRLNEIRVFPLRGYYYEGQIDLKLFRARHQHYQVLAVDPLILQAQSESYIVLTKFGGVILWNCSDVVAQELKEELANLPGTELRSERAEEQIEVSVGHEEERVTFNDIRLRELGLEHVKVISAALAQSIALDHFEFEVRRALDRIYPVLAELRERGAVKTPRRQMLRGVGFALEVRAAVLANLTLFTEVPETWENERLARLHKLLSDFFDLTERHQAIMEKVEFLTDVNDTFIDVLETRTGHRLEWIIILLIAFEIVTPLFKKLWAMIGVDA